ncbi:DBF4-type zinc finger-containing protein 2 [Thalassophryne amazonica]|uniref:DBF4-type zinc finger-containing protein 2 n=1 Tax=Thalassophryne amazonica TaxID=390379 RepID=UPI001470EFC4|nr:DBF4-type zinc finger-containing protein 2 [Thalassophryne amazonica]XP_034035836.1 DBF4-type zinc finger-containing protein 2 [Thalassophryne amazonica]
MWAESQPGPSRSQTNRQGYCGYCRVLYSSLEQHLSSLTHLQSVQASARGSSSISSASSTRQTLLERFLQDVLQYHPHCYSDPRPSHADLPLVSLPVFPRVEVDEACWSNDDSPSLVSREDVHTSEDSFCQVANQEKDYSSCRKSAQRLTWGGSHVRLFASVREQEGQAPPTPAPALPPQAEVPPSLHKKAHRKTNRRKASDSSSSCGRGRAWLSWLKERREVQKEQVFSPEEVDYLDQAIDQVIQRYCHGRTSTTCQEEETESFQFSLPVSLETQSDDWDSPVQMVFQRPLPVQVGRDWNSLMDAQVDLEEQEYSDQLDSALYSRQKVGGGLRQQDGYRTLPIEKILPTPAHIPESFRGKTWTQIEKEDEEKVEKLVQQFRRGRFICYFDSESLSRYGRRSQKLKGCGEEEVEPDAGILPLLDDDDDDDDEADPVSIRRVGRRRRAFRVASRCQVVRVSHGTQTPQRALPGICQSASQATSTSVLPANQDPLTPEVHSALTWQCLPPSYSHIITPLQTHTPLIYLLCSPTSPASKLMPSSRSASKRCRKKKRPVQQDIQGLKVKYKRLPFRFYDPSTNRILKNAPKGLLWRCSSAVTPPPPCVRQLFRSLSPDLNAEQPASGSPRVKFQRSSVTTVDKDSVHAAKQEPPRRRGRTSDMAPPPVHTTSRLGRGGREGPRERTGPSAYKRGRRQAGHSRKLPRSTSAPPTKPLPHATSRKRRRRGRRGRTCCGTGQR